MPDIGERQLVSIRTVDEITPIEGADRIVVASVGGWNCIVKKDEVEVGSKVLYFEIDSFLPASDERFSFLSKNFIKWTDNTGVTREGARLRSMRMKGVLSQGLAMPMFQFSDVIDFCDNSDLQTKLGVVKYEKAIPTQLAGKVKSANLPFGLPKTDQERIQNLGLDLLCHSTTNFEITTKLDGSSMTVYYNKEQDVFGVCSRNLDLYETPENSMWQVARRLGLEERLRKFCTGDEGWAYNLVALQGEIMGPGIQGNREGLNAHDFFVFDIFANRFNLDGNKILSEYLFPEQRRRVLKEYFENINHCPILEDCVKLNSKGLSLQDLRKSILEKANETKSLNHEIAEGIVFKSYPNPRKEYFTFKAISNKFLEKDKN